MKGVIVVQGDAWFVRYERSPAVLKLTIDAPRHVFYPIVGRESLREYAPDEQVRPGAKVTYLGESRWRGNKDGWIVRTGNVAGTK